MFRDVKWPKSRGKPANVEACAAVSSCEVSEVIANKAIRCAGCKDLVEANRPPAFVDTCTSNARKFGDRTAMLADAEKRLPLLKKSFPLPA